MSSIDEFLAAEIAEGSRDSVGQFTVAPEKALEKLAAFQLPSGTAWALKMVQVAVSSGCTQLHIQLASNASEFRLIGHPGWSADAFEEAFYDPNSTQDRSLQHLKQALWSVGLHAKRPFYVACPQWKEAIVWNGRRLSRRPWQASKETLIVVSQRVCESGPGIPILREIQAAERNAELLRELRGRAFSCPIPLTVNARRLDALQHCPGHGLSASSYPVMLECIPGPLPSLQLPAQTAGGFEIPTGTHPRLQRLLAPSADPAEAFALACLLTAHVREVTREKATAWEVWNHACRRR